MNKNVCIAEYSDVVICTFNIYVYSGECIVLEQQQNTKHQFQSAVITQMLV